MMPKVLHLIPTLGKGGAERQVSLVLVGLKKLGLDVALCFHTGGSNIGIVEQSGIRLFNLPPWGNHDPRLMRDIFGVVHEYKPNIIQTWLPQMDVLGGLVAHRMGIPHIISERSSSNMYESGGWKNFLRVAIGKRAHAIIANSEGGAKYWRDQRARGRLHVVRNALTPPSSEPAPLAQLRLEGRRLLVAAGRLSHEKNLPVLVKAMALTLAKLPEHHGVIFGEGPERDATFALIEGTGLSSRLHLGGYASNLSGWMRAAEVFISASLIEGYPNVVIEAASAGCPMVLSDIPAHREFAVGDSALFAPATHAELLAEAIVESVCDRAQAQARSGRAQALTQPLSVQAAAQLHSEIYHSLLN